MILQSTDYTHGQAGWTFNGTAATFAGEGHGLSGPAGARVELVSLVVP